MRVPDLLLGLAAGPADQAAGARFGQLVLAGSLGRRAGLLLFFRQRTGRSSAAFARRHVGAAPPLQPRSVVGVAGEDAGQREKRAEDLLDVDVVLGRAF